MICWNGNGLIWIHNDKLIWINNADSNNVDPDLSIIVNYFL